MTTTAKLRRRRLRATAARQALNLCEAEQLRLTWDAPGFPHSITVQGRPRAATTRAALRAAGVPPLIAAALRARLRLLPEQEAE